MAVALLLSAARSTEARDKPMPFDNPLGQWVVTIRETRLKVLDKTIVTVGAGAVLLVKRTQAPWLWIDYGDFGWVRDADVVPLKRAEAYFSERIRRNPGDREALLGRGVARLRALEADINFPNEQPAEKSVDDFSAVIRMTPKSAAAYALRAEALKCVGGARGHDAAVADIEEALRLAPQNAAYHIVRASLAVWDSDIDKALACLNRAIELDAASAAAFFARGKLWMELPPASDSDIRFSESVTKAECMTRTRSDLDEAIRLEPDYVPAHRDRGELLIDLGEYAEAIRDFDVVIRLDPQGLTFDCIRALCARGGCRVELGDYQNALADYTESIRCEEAAERRGCTMTHGNSLYIGRAELYAACPDPQIRDAQKALADAERACRVSKDGHNLPSLAAAYAEAGDFEKAIESQQEAILAVERDRRDSDPEWLRQEDSKALEEYRSRLALYESHQPYRLAVAKRPEHK
jgi:tetratricopeptide (TPR) repeat protein